MGKGENQIKESGGKSAELSYINRIKFVQFQKRLILKSEFHSGLLRNRFGYGSNKISLNKISSVSTNSFI